MKLNYVLITSEDIVLDKLEWNLSDSDDVKQLLEVKLKQRNGKSLLSSWGAYAYNPYYVLTIL